MPTNLLPLLADRVINRPLLILPDKLAVVAQVLSGRIGIDASGLAPDASRFAGTARNGEPYRVTRDGAAIVPIVGSLVNRGGWIGAQSGLVSYEGLAHQLQTAARDARVKAIVLDIDSPGGEAAGAFELAEIVRKVNAAKPVYAMANGMAASAAYAIASAARAIFATPSAVVGSIGVVLLHSDHSRALEKAGVKPTMIFAGKHKTAGNPYQPLPKTVRADLQAEVDTFYRLFLETVAKGRGVRLTKDAAKATEARTFIGLAAKKAGLIDDIGSFEELLSNVTNAPARASKPKGIKTMIDPSFFADDYGPRPAAAEPSRAQLDGAYMRGKIAGELAERGRIAALMSSPLAKENIADALSLALNPGCTEDLIASGLEALKIKRAAEADASWNEIAEKLNAEQRRGKPAAVKDAANANADHAEDFRPAQAGAMSIDEIVDALNKEAR